MSGQFLKFALAGGFAASVNWGSRFAFSTVMPFEASVVCAYLVGMTTAFLLNRQFVFKRSGRGAREEYFRFALVNVIALVQVWAVTMALSKFILPMAGVDIWRDAIAHAAGVVSPILTSFFGHKHFSFARAELDRS